MNQDPACDPRCPKTITYDSVVNARSRIKDNVNWTRCKYSKVLSEVFKMNIYLKLENEQVTGSFKYRGAFNALKSLLESQGPELHVSTASPGNHAIALANAGKKLGVAVTVVMPASTSLNKVEACKKSHAEVILHGSHVGEAKDLGLKLSQERGYTFINGFDHPDVLSGQGTMASEIFEDVPNVDAIVVPTGGGGLIAGVSVVAAHVRPECKIVGVESAASTGFSQALEKGHPVDTKLSETLAHGLAVPTSGVNAVASAKDKVHKMLTVRESSLVLAILKLFEIEKTVAEGAGAAGVAALVEGLLSEFTGKTVVILVTGGNIDTTVFGDVIQRGLILDGRLVRFETSVSDMSSGLSTLTKVIDETSCSLKDIQKEIKWPSHDNYIIVVKGLVETRNREHSLELQSALQNQFPSICFDS